jgi:hypothetical protein
MRKESKVSGMWRLPAASLERLDQLAVEECNRIEEATKKSVEAHIKKLQAKDKREHDYSALSDDERKRRVGQIREEVKAGVDETQQIVARVTLADGTWKDAPTFREHLLNKGLETAEVVGISLTFKCYGAWASVTFPSVGTLSLRSQHDVEVATIPTGHAEMDTTRAKVVKWAEEFRAPAYYRVWKRFHPAQWFLLLFLFLFLMGCAEYQNNRVVNQEAQEILEQGVNDGNRDRAIEVLLQSSTKTYKPSNKRELPKVVGLLFWGYVILCVLLSFPPSDVIGIGRGAHRMRHWDWYYTAMRYVFVTVLLGGVGVSMLATVASDYLKTVFG